jgi:hypothetical protein
LSGLGERAGSARSATTVRIAIIGPFFFPQLDGVEKGMLTWISNRMTATANGLAR